MEVGDARKTCVFRISKASSIWLIASWSSLSCLPQLHRNVPSKNVVEAWCALNWWFLQLHELHMAHFESGTAGFSDEQPSSPSLSLLEYKFCSNEFRFFHCLLYSYQWVLVSLWDEYHRPLQKWLAPISWMLAPLPSRVSYRLALLLGFPKLRAVSRSLELLFLLLRSPIPLQRDLGCWPWCCEPFEDHSISVLRSHTINAVSWHCGVSYDCKWFCLPESQSLILRSWQFYPRKSILMALPVRLVMYLFWGTV